MAPHRFGMLRFPGMPGRRAFGVLRFTFGVSGAWAALGCPESGVSVDPAGLDRHASHPQAAAGAAIGSTRQEKEKSFALFLSFRQEF